MTYVAGIVSIYHLSLVHLVTKLTLFLFQAVAVSALAVESAPVPAKDTLVRHISIL